MRQVVDDDSGAVVPKLGCVLIIEPVDPDHVSEPPVMPGLYAGDRVLETAAAAGSTPASAAPARNESGAGLPLMFRCRNVFPSIGPSNRPASPVTFSTSVVFALEDTT